jgi:hypothetical protein
MAPAAVVAPAMPAMTSSFTSSERRTFQESRSIHSSSISYRESGKRSNRNIPSIDTASISNVVYSLQRRSGDELGSSTSTKLLDQTYDTVREWIAAQRMSHLPPEGSSYDKVLTWTQLFVERINSFDEAIQGFARDSYLASQLAYGYCSILLNVRILVPFCTA